MRDRAVALLVIAATAAMCTQTALAHSPGGRTYASGAKFSAGVSGTDGVSRSLFSNAFLDSLVRVSNDLAVGQPLQPWELTTSGTAFLDSQTEPWVDVNPENALHAVGMFQEDRWSTGGARNLTFAVTFNGGKTWRNIALPGVSRLAGGTYERVTDPWVDFGPGGRVHATSLAFDDSTFRNAIFAHTSNDGGLTWRPPVLVKADTQFEFFNDRNSLAVDDFPSSPYYGRVYIGWDRLANKGPGYAYTGDGLVAYSANGGASFSAPITAVPTKNNEQTLTNLPVVQPDGTVVLVGTYYWNQSFGKNGGKFFVTRSHNGGRTWDPVAFPEDERPVGVPNVRGGDGVPSMAVDRRTGKLYAVWQDSRFSGGKRDDVLLISSTDAGRTWTAPMKVNDTPAGAQAAFTPVVQVDASGRVAVLYYDLRDDASARDGSILTTEWIAFSTNGGRTFGQSRRLSPTFDHTAAAFAGGYFLGDYQGLGVGGTTFMPFFGANLATQANGQLGSDVFATNVR